MSDVPNFSALRQKALKEIGELGNVTRAASEGF